MSLPKSEPIPSEEPESLPPARRRRKLRMILPSGASDRAAFMEELAQKAIPSFDFFLFSLLSGLVLGIAILLDSPALFILAALVAPFLAPVVGLSLATIVGSLRFFLRILGSIIIGSLLAFSGSAFCGLFTQTWPDLSFQQAIIHTYFSWTDMLVLILGAGLTTYLMIRSPQQRPMVASVALAYELYLPLGVAGFGLASGVVGFWPDGLIVFAVYLALTALIGTVILAFYRLRPLNLFGYTLGSTFALAGLTAAIVASGLGTAVTTHVAMPPLTPTITPTITPTHTLTATPLPPTRTLTPTNTLIPTNTPTMTASPVPTPVWARINAKEGGGAVIRTEPSFSAEVITSLSNGMLVKILPEEKTKEGVIWAHILTTSDIEAWIVRSLLRTATPQTEG